MAWRKYLFPSSPNFQYSGSWYLTPLLIETIWKSVIISIVDLYEQTSRLAYFWARTGPDFMHPIYTLGFDRCLAKVAPSVAAKIWLNVRKHGQKKVHGHWNIIKPIRTATNLHDYFLFLFKTFRNRERGGEKNKT